MDIKITILLLLAFGASYFLIPMLLNFSKKFNIKDKAGKRKRHKHDISMLGGVPIFLTFILSIVFFSESSEYLSKAYVTLAFSILFFAGIVDDLWPMNALKKFFFQILAAVLLVYMAGVHHSSYFTQLSISEDLIKIISVVFIVFIINAYNLIDGINGLSAMLSSVALLSFGMWFYTAGLYSHAYVCFAVTASIMAFLRYNLFNTKIFLGDNGSMTLGLLIAYFSTVTIQYNQNLSNEFNFKLVAPFGVAIAAMAIPIMDTIRLFLMRSIYLEKSPFQADRNHLHHLLLRLGLSHVQISILLSVVTTLLLAFSFSAQRIGNTGIIFIIVLIFLALLITIDYFIFSIYRKKLAQKTVFNQATLIRAELNNPMIYEFLFALSVMILAVAIPFHRVSASIPTLFVGLTFLILVFRNLIKDKSGFLYNSKPQVLQFLKHPYSILIISILVFYTFHYLIFPTDGGTALSLKVLLIVYWIPIFELQKIIKIKPEAILKAYVYGCFGFGVYILYHAFFAFHSIGWNAFFYSELLSHVKANPITHSLYFNLALVFLAANFQKLKNKTWKLIHLGIFLFLIGMIILFSSKIGYVVLLFSFTASIFLMNKNRSQRIAIIGLMVIMAVLSYYNVPYLNKRINGFVWQISKHEKIPLQHRLPRTIVWEQAVTVIKDNWLLGTGVGNSMNTLQKQYEKIGYAKGAERKFNSHNQFLESFLQVGIVGFISLLALMLYCFRVAIKRNDKVYLIYLCIILLYMQVQSLFETQMGIVAFAFFNSIFLSSHKIKAHKS